MQKQNGFWDVEHKLKELSADGDHLQKLAATVDFEICRPVLRRTVDRGAGDNGGLPGFDPVLKFKMLSLKSLYGLPRAHTSYMVRDRLSWMRCR